MLGAAEVNHLKSEGLLSEVCRPTEGDRQVDLADGIRLLPRDDPLKGRSRGSQACVRYPHGRKCFSVEDVEATTSIHEHLTQALGADDGVDDEGIPPRLWNMIWMVAVIKGDRRLRPLEVRGSGVAGGVYLTSGDLLLTLGAVRRWATEDHHQRLVFQYVALLLGATVAFACAVPLLSVPLLHATEEEVLHEPVVLQEMLDRGRVVEAGLLQHLLKVVIDLSRGLAPLAVDGRH